MQSRAFVFVQFHAIGETWIPMSDSQYKYSLIFVYTDENLHHTDVSLFGEPAEFEYLRKVLFEYMMGRETKVWEVVYGDT